VNPTGPKKKIAPTGPVDAPTAKAKRSDTAKAAAPRPGAQPNTVLTKREKIAGGVPLLIRRTHTNTTTAKNDTTIGEKNANWNRFIRRIAPDSD
jgi:hypothetical protein